MTNNATATFLARLSQASEQEPENWTVEESEFAAKLAAGLSDEFANDAAPASEAEIAAYLDDGLDDDEREAFHVKLLASPELREEITDLAHRLMAIDESVELPASLAFPTADVIGRATAKGLRANFLQGKSLSSQQQRALFTDLSLRSEFNRLIRSERLQPPPPADARPSSATRALPARIAASSDRHINDREFPGGSIHIGSAGRPNLLQLRIKSDSTDAVGEVLELNGPDGSLAYLTLPAPDADGEITKVVDLKLEHEALAIELLRNPLTVGRFRPA